MANTDWSKLEEEARSRDTYRAAIEGIIRCLTAIEMDKADKILEHSSSVYRDTVKRLERPNLDMREEHERLKKAYEDFYERYRAYERAKNERFKKLV